MPIKKENKTKSRFVRVTLDQDLNLVRISKKNKATVSDVIRHCIDEFLQNEKKGKK